MTKRTTKTAEPAKPLIGRPPGPPEARAAVRAVRLTDADYAKFHAVGGVAWLRDKLRRAKAPER